MSSISNKVFHFYSNLPPELRMMVVDEMGPKDRCLFAATSRLSWKEAKKSKNAIWGIAIDECFGKWYISVFMSSQTLEHGFKLFYENENGHRMEYQNMEWDTLWELELDNSTDVNYHAIAHFKNLLRMYQNTIKFLRIGVNHENLRNINDEFDNLKNLHSLHISSEMDIRQFIPKIRRQLESLHVEGVENCRIAEEWEQTYLVQDNIALMDTNLTYDQFLRLSAKSVDLSIGQLTEQDILHFLKSWHTGTYSGRIESCKWTVGDSDFYRIRLHQLVRDFEGAFEGTNGKTYIEQKDSGELAKLDNWEDQLRFITTRYEDELNYESDEAQEDEEEEEEDEEMDDEEYEDFEEEPEIEVIQIDDSDEDDDVIYLD